MSWRGRIDDRMERIEQLTLDAFEAALGRPGITVIRVMSATRQS
jgi:hypothetical protein